MSPTASLLIDRLVTPEPPWLHVGDGGRLVERLTAALSAQAVVKVLRGRRMHNDLGLFAEFSRALNLPAYFGHNWASLEECLVDLSWLPAPGYLLIVDGAENLLHDEPPQRTALFVDLIERIAAGWAGTENGTENGVETGTESPAAVPFHLALVTSTAGRSRVVTARWAAAGLSLDRLN